MSDIAAKVREIGTVEGVHLGTAQEVEAVWRDASLRVLPEIIAEEWESSFKFPGVHAAFERQAYIYRTARM